MSTVKHGDKYPIELGVNMDLTGCTVRLLCRRRYTTGTPAELDATITDEAEGIVSHTLTGTLQVGVYELEVEVTRAGEVVSFPTRQDDGAQFVLLQVIPDLEVTA